MADRKNNRTKAQGAETRRQIYESAELLFGQYDYKDVSVEAITKMAGVTKGTFYVHFESKDALYTAFLLDYAERMDTQYKSSLDAMPPEMSSSEMLLALVANIIDMMTAQIGYENMRTVYRLQLTNMASMEAVKGYGRKLYALFQQVLERGIRQGEFKSALCLEGLTRHFVMAIRGLTYEWCIRHPDFDFKQEAEAHFRLLLEGIRE